MINKYNMFFDKCLKWFFGEHKSIIDFILVFLSTPFMFVFMVLTFVVRLIIAIVMEVCGYDT